MIELLTKICSFICGQAHCSYSNGLMMPICQRCTGLYVGSAIGFIAWRSIRPRMTSQLVGMHVACLLVTIPFGFHWVAQGEVLRIASGMMFGVGLVGCLCFGAGAYTENRQHGASLIRYAAWVVFGCATVLIAITWLHLFWTLIYFVIVGVAVVAGLLVANLNFLTETVREKVCRVKEALAARC